jgi:hypothetical protein
VTEEAERLATGRPLAHILDHATLRHTA